MNAPRRRTCDPIYRLDVRGVPRPGGSKTPQLVRRKGGAIVMVDGRPLITVRDDAKGGAQWREACRYKASRTWALPPLAGPLLVDVRFYVARPRGHLGASGTPRPSAPRYPAVRPDATKLWRAVEDSMTKIVWRDDAQVVMQTVTKLYADGRAPGVEVDVWEVE